MYTQRNYESLFCIFAQGGSANQNKVNGGVGGGGVDHHDSYRCRSVLELNHVMRAVLRHHCVYWGQTTTLETVRTGKPREVTYGRSQLFTGGGST